MDDIVSQLWPSLDSIIEQTYWIDNMGCSIGKTSICEELFVSYILLHVYQCNNDTQVIRTRSAE